MFWLTEKLALELGYALPFPFPDKLLKPLCLGSGELPDTGLGEESKAEQLRKDYWLHSIA